MELVKWALDIVKRILRFFIRIFEIFAEWFLEINFFEKLIVITAVPSFFAIILPVARYYIFETWFMINNPLAVYLIGIVFVMGLTVFFPGTLSLIIREFLNGLYLANVILMQVSHNISKAPYELSTGYYVNLAVPVIFMILGLLSYLVFNRD